MNKIHTHANKTFTHGRKEGGRQALEGQLGFFGLFWFVFWFVFFCFVFVFVFLLLLFLFCCCWFFFLFFFTEQLQIILSELRELKVTFSIP